MDADNAITPKRTPRITVDKMPLLNLRLPVTTTSADTAPGLTPVSASSESENRQPLTPSEGQSIIMRQSVLTSGALRSPNSVPEGVKPMSSETLASLLESEQDKVLLVDVRPVASSLYTRIPGAITLCVPSTLLKRGSFGYDRIIELVAAEDRARLEKIEDFHTVVLYDEGTLDLRSCGPVPLFHTVLKFHSSHRAVNKLWYLQGGFKQFKDKFPQYIENFPQGGLQETNPEQKKTATSPITPFSLQPVLTSLRDNYRWSRSLPGTSVAPVDNTALRIIESVHEIRDLLPPALRSVVNRTLQGENPIAEKFGQLQAEEQLRLTKVYFRDPKTDSSPTRSTTLKEGSSKGSPWSSSPSSQFSPSQSKLDNDNIDYVLFTGNDFTKNRYSNICPYDHTRVVVEQNGYINASYIRTSFSKLKYIATQAPVPNSFGDFWRVVFDHKMPVVVMLTALATEGGRIKSHKYWDVGDYDGVEIVSVEEEKYDMDLIAVRHILLRKGDATHRLAQMQYMSWTDLGRPRKVEDVVALVQLKAQLLKQYQQTANESDWVLVHCSAGCGRTGTFCIVDSVIDYFKNLPSDMRAKDENDIIYNAVRELRCQRIGMVQVQQQFSLCYEAVLMWYVDHYLSGNDDCSACCNFSPDKLKGSSH